MYILPWLPLCLRWRLRNTIYADRDGNICFTLARRASEALYAALRSVMIYMGISFKDDAGIVARTIDLHYRNMPCYELLAGRDQIN